MSDQTIIELLERTASRVPDSDVPLPTLLHDGRRGLRRTRAALVAGSMAAILAVVGVGVAVRGLDHGGTTSPAAAGPPAPPPGMKWSGIGTTVVAVPQSWSMWPGLYCSSGDGHDHVTILQAHVAPPCANPAGPMALPAADLVALRDEHGALTVETDLPRAQAGMTQQLIEQSRTTLPYRWLAVPAATPEHGIGEPTAAQEARALVAAGFVVSRVQEPRWDNGPRVRTVPEIGAPAPLGSTVTVYDRIAAPAVASLTGRLLWVGGPPGPAVPHAGTVHVVGDGLDAFVPVDADGRWSFDGPAGTFTVTASSPGYLSKHGTPDSCRAARPVTLRWETTVQANVYCQLR